MTETDRDFLYRQLDCLGQMLADGLGDEPDGKWIGRTESINKFMAQRVKDEHCNICKGVLKQTRSGSFIAACTSCGRKWRLGYTSRRKRRGTK